MAEVIFISIKYIKDNTAIEQNVDDSKITPYIRKAQNVYIMQLLGESFYNHLVTAVAGSSLTAQEDAFIRQYLQPTLAEYAFYEMYPFLGIKTTNKGQSKENSEFSSNADLNEMKYMRNAIKDMADLYSIRLTKELKRGYDAGYFPLAKAIVGDNPQKTNTSFSGIYLEGGRRAVRRPDSSPIKNYGDSINYFD